MRRTVRFRALLHVWPRICSRQKSPVALSALERRPAHGGLTMKYRNVLIVDNDLRTQVELSELLSAAGYCTSAVGTFQEARHALRNDPPDLLVADIRLGAFNGLHLLITARARLPVIIMTGFHDPVLEADARTYGAEYIVKPLDPSSFLRLVQRLLDNGDRNNAATP